MDSTRLCSVEECDRPRRGRGYCGMHYKRVVTYGDPHFVQKIRRGGNCTFGDCERVHYAHGFCRMHWERNHINGSPEPTRVLQGGTVSERLAHHSERAGDCTEWTGYRDKDGYGQIQVDGRPERAHRVAYELRHGAIPEGQLLRHTCDNPPCINPDHLVPGDEAENSQDMIERGRSLAGERNPAAKLSPQDVARIRDLAGSGVQQREIAESFSLGQSHVSRIVRGESWAS